MSQGRQISIYIASDVMPYLDVLSKQSEAKDVALSTSVADAIVSGVKQNYARIDISIGAYLALHDGRFDLLEYVKSDDDDTVNIVLKSKGRKLYEDDVANFKMFLRG